MKLPDWVIKKRDEVLDKAEEVYREAGDVCGFDRKSAREGITVFYKELVVAEKQHSTALAKALDDITVRMNQVTALWRHRQEVDEDKMDALCNIQIDGEKALEEYENGRKEEGKN